MVSIVKRVHGGDYLEMATQTIDYNFELSNSIQNSGPHDPAGVRGRGM